MTIVVIGPGAIGLLCAIRLAHAGQAVTLLARPTMAAQLAAQPLSMLHNGERIETTAVTVVGDAAEIVRDGVAPALAVVCVKGYDTAGVLPTLDRLKPAQVLTLQNGIGNEAALAAHIGDQRLISGAITTSVEIDAPGAISVTKEGGVAFAPFHSATAGQLWADVFAAAGFRTRVFADYRALKWSKALLNMLGNATAAILDMPVADVYADRRLVALERRAFLEALHTMQRQGIRPVNLPRYPAALLAQGMQRVPIALLHPLLRRVVAGGRGGKPPSLHLDLLRGNPRSEGQFLYGAIAEAAAQSGLAAPVNRMLWATLRAIAQGEAEWSTFRGQPEALIAAVARADG